MSAACETDAFWAPNLFDVGGMEFWYTVRGIVYRSDARYWCVFHRKLDHATKDGWYHYDGMRDYIAAGNGWLNHEAKSRYVPPAEFKVDRTASAAWLVFARVPYAKVDYGEAFRMRRGRKLASDSAH